jgi:hypothetical protein
MSTIKQTIPHSFEDVQVDDSDENDILNGNRCERSPTSNVSLHVDSRRRHQAPQQLTCNEQMLLESMLDDDRNDCCHPIENNDYISPSHSNVHRGFPLVDADENLCVSQHRCLCFLCQEKTKEKESKCK